MPETVQVFCGLLSGQQVVVVDVDGLIGVLLCLADQHIEQPLAVQIVDDGVMFPGIQNDKAAGVIVLCQCADGAEQFLVVLSGDDGADIFPPVAELADSPDGFQIKGVLVDVSGRRRKDDSDELGSLSAAGGYIGFIAELCHGLTDFFFCFPADGRVVFTGAGYGGWGDTDKSGDIPDGDCHRRVLLFVSDSFSVLKGLSRSGYGSGEAYHCRERPGLPGRSSAISARSLPGFPDRYP